MKDSVSPSTGNPFGRPRLRKSPQNCPMCLVALAWKTHPRWRLLLAGNRDEAHARPTAALARWAGPDGLFAGRDLLSGGTWMGLDALGRCAVVTNVRNGFAKPTSGPSRGQLPVGFLGDTDSADAMADALPAQAPAFAPFNLLLADADACRYVGNHPQAKTRRIEPGIHGLSNGEFDAPWPKTRRLRETLRAWISIDAEDLQPLWNALADESIAPDTELPDTGVGIEWERQLSPAFIRGETYGTRASTLIAIDHAGRGFIHERRFGPNGVFLGETVLRNDA